MRIVRLESLADAVFALVFVSLVLRVGVPDLFAPTDTRLTAVLFELWPYLVSYTLTSIVLMYLWYAHSILYGTLLKEINRPLVLLDLVFIACVAALSFSAHFLGTYLTSPVALLLFGAHVCIIGTVFAIAFQYACTVDPVIMDRASSTLLGEARVRSLVVPVCALIGMVCVGLGAWVSVVWYVAPIVFVIVPGLCARAARQVGWSYEKG